MSHYRVAPIFLIRMAGVPFEALEALATPELIAQARILEGLEEECEVAVRAAEKFFDSGEHLLSRESYRELKSAVRARRLPRPQPAPQPSVFTDFADAIGRVESTRAQAARLFPAVVERSRDALVRNARAYLPRQLIFNTGGIAELLRWLMEEVDAGESHKPRNSRTRERDRHLLLYLQRACGKNDSFSEFGPTSWGRAHAAVEGFRFAPEPGITVRETFVERWVAHVFAAAMNNDPSVFDELSPRLNPLGRREGSKFVFADTGIALQLTAAQNAALDRFDGRTPNHALEAGSVVSDLVKAGVVICEVEVPALDPHAAETLLRDVRAWRPGATRDRWQEALLAMTSLARRFAATEATAERLAILQESEKIMRSFGTERPLGERHLYAARNAIGEECFRRSNFEINTAMLDQVATDAAPWIDLWRDTYAFIASRVAAGMREVFERNAQPAHAVPVPMFLKWCAEARLSLTGPGLVVLAHLAFQEVRAAFFAALEPHRDKAEHELSTDECHVVRRHFDYPKFDEYTFPSADLQLIAASAEAAGNGNYQWLLAELHPPVAMLHHGAYWSCPDHAQFHEALGQTVGGKPNVHFGFAAADFTAHTTVRIFDALPGESNFVAPARCNPAWRSVPPADAEVFVDATTGDVAVRHRDSGEYLGSLTRGWLIPLGFHPFQFAAPPHMPRLRCGRVIVQRRTWVVQEEELGTGDFSGVSRDLVVAIDRLRLVKNWPRYIYTRPTERALRRSGAEGRDKDTKPIFVDLESYLCLELFHRWLVKAGELEVTEMLPDPAHLCWQESDGRRTFELRTLIVPRT